MKNLIVLIGLMMFAWQASLAQTLVPLGEGSYSQTPPAYKAGRYDLFPWPDERGLGDKSYEMVYNRDIYVVEGNTKPIPTNDWLTSIFKNKYCGELWAYPLTVSASSTGLLIEYPHEWNDAGSHMESNSEMSIKGANFTPIAALANSWGDWTIDFVMPDDDKEMKVTLGHGLPFVWVETKTLTPEIEANFTATFNGDNEAIEFPITTKYIGVEIGGDYYGIYAPAGTVFDKNDNIIEVSLSSADGYVIVGALPEQNLLDDYADYAYVIPRDSRVDFNYVEEDGKLYTTWNLETENLLGESNLDVIQGFIPHHYRTTEKGFDFDEALSYDTPRGLMQSGKGNNFTFDYKFNGLLPVVPTPQDYDVTNSFDSTMVKEGIEDFTGNTTYGADTYWGGKDLVMKAQYAMIAKSMDMEEASEKIQENLVTALSDWYTFDPGETEYCFTYYPNWGGMVGYNPSYFSDEFTDHHFHYGYFSLASGILALINPDFNKDYGSMAKLVASDYANWKRDDDMMPYFRTMDIWAGHSYAGGLVDGGNGQESSSEAMQSWGGLFMLAMGTKDFEMRDAAIFGYVSEGQATAEYWFDRYKKNPEDEFPARNNISENYQYPYNTNLESGGIGYWNWFSGNMGFNHAIQWIPWSPVMKYLYADPEFMQWEHDFVLDTWVNNEEGWATETQYYEGWAGMASIDILSTADPEAAVAKLQECRDNGLEVGTDALRHFNLHSDRTYGSVVWDRYIDYPLSSIYFNEDTKSYTYVVYNSELEERTFSVYDYNTGLVAAFKAPAGQLTTYTTPPVLSRIVIESDAISIEPGEIMQFVANTFDQYDASFSTTVSWSVSGGGTINSDGLFTATTSGEYTLSCLSGSLTETINIRVDDAPVLTTINLEAENYVVEQEHELQFYATSYDQYGDLYDTDFTWAVTGGGSVNENGLFTASDAVGEFVLSAEAEGVTQTVDFRVRMPLVNVALGKPAYASSQENVSFPADLANDGVSSATSRWSSASSDNQYWAVDLSGSYDINYISIDWETAHAESYNVYISTEVLDAGDIAGHDWGDPVYMNSNGSSGVQSFTVEAEAKCIYVECLTRATSYGFSILEFEAFGLPVSGEDAEMIFIDISPKFGELTDFDSIQLSAKAYDQFGVEMALTPTWGMLQESDGTIDAEGWYKPAEWVKGIVVIKAEENGVVGLGNVVVQPSYEKIVSIVIEPETTDTTRLEIAEGTAYRFTAAVINQFSWDIEGDITWTTSEGGGTIASTGFYTATTLGEHEIYATCQGIEDTAFVTVTTIDGVNVALGKSTIASSTETDLSSSNAVDGNESTRWGSAFNAEASWQVDLQAVYNLTTVQIVWNSSYAKEYNLEISEDGTNWTTAYTKTGNTGGTEDIDLAGYDAKYIRINCTDRQNPIYGYSFYEFKVYASGIVPTPALSAMTIEPQRLWITQDSVVSFEAFAYDQFGDDFDADVTWEVLGSGSIDATGNYTPDNAGTFYVYAKADGLSAEAKLTVMPLEIGEVNQEPRSSIIAPEAGRILKDETVSIQATAYDFDGEITKVEFYVDGQLLGEKTSLPYTMDWTPDLESEYEVYLMAYDEVQGTQSASVKYRAVDEINPPTLILSSPVSTKLILNEWVDLIADAYFFDEAIASVEFYVDNVLLATDNTAPYVYPWLPTVNKDYEIFALAYDVNSEKYSTDTLTVGLLLETVVISPEMTSIDFGETQQFELYGYDQNGFSYALSELNWEVSNDGNIVDGLFRADKIGDFLITGSSEGVKDTMTVVVSSTSPLPTTMIITSDKSVIKEGETIQFACEVFDQDDVLMDVDVSYECYLNVIDNDGLFTGLYTGTYQVSAQVTYTVGFITETLSSSLEVKVYPNSTTNLALDYISATAGSNSNNAKWAVDGLSGTRWEPVADADIADLTWTVKLDKAYYIGAILIEWETAGAQSYSIQSSQDSSLWTDIYHYNPEDTARSIENYEVDSLAVYAPAQYLRFIGFSRTYFTYGPSFWEFEVYEAGHEMGDLHSIDLTPEVATINEGERLLINASPVDDNGDPVIAEVLWSVNSEDADISDSGEFYTVSSGEYEVTAQSGSVEAKATITVLDVSEIESIDISPKADTITELETKQFSAQGYDQFGEELSASYVWTTSGGTISTDGLYTPDEGGAFKIYATAANGVKDSSILVVREIPRLTRISITPENTTIPRSTEQQMIATAYDQMGDLMDVTIAWSCEGGAISSTGVFSSEDEGQFKIIAKSLDVTDTTNITVSDTPTLTRLELTPKDDVLLFGESLQFNTTGYDQYGDVFDTSLAYSCASGTISETGMFIADELGDFQVFVRSNDIADSTYIKVKHLQELSFILISPDTDTLKLGEVIQFSAQGYDQDSDIMDVEVTWQNSGSGTMVDGLYTASAIGVDTVYASSDLISASIGFLVIEGETGIELEKETLVSIYPNPVQELLTVEWESANYNRILLFSTNGSLIQKKEIPTASQSTTLDLGRLNAGIYYVVLRGEKGDISHKITKQ